jgi:Spherulation-specific family 4
MRDRFTKARYPLEGGLCREVPARVGIMRMSALQLMPLRVCASLLVVVVALLTALVILLIPGSSGQSMAVPAFFPPGRLWSQVDSAVPTLQLVVLDPASGPGAAYDQAYGSVVRTAQKHGITVVGYVDTNYGARSLSAVESDVDNYYSWYHVNGIFFDRASTDCALAVAPASYYATLNAYVKAKGGAARTILNPGEQTNECFLADADILLTFEGSDTQYVNSYSAPSWVAKYAPSHFWHIIYATSSASAMARAVRLSKQRGAGLVYVTPDALPSPYDTLPTGRYWRTELGKLRG